MLVDAFLYNGEADLLELRWQELHRHVDLFLAVEGNLTFTGKNRTVSDLSDIPNLQHLVVKDFPEAKPGNEWKREYHQRNSMLKGLVGLPEDTIVMVSDADEIPDYRVLPKELKTGNIIALEQQWYQFNFNNRVNDMWRGTRICRLGDLRIFWPQGVRNKHFDLIKHGGWHFSWFQEPEKKLDSYSHQELKRFGGSLAQKVQARWKLEYQYLAGYSHLPQCIQDDLPRWAKYFEKGAIDGR